MQNSQISMTTISSIVIRLSNLVCFFAIFIFDDYQNISESNRIYLITIYTYTIIYTYTHTHFTNIKKPEYNRTS